MRPETKHAAPIRIIAIYEAIKGVLVLAVGAGVLGFLHRHAQHAVEDIVGHFHLNPAREHPRIFERVLQNVTDGQLRWLALGALGYAGLHLVEAWGLWRERRWAEWLATLSGAIYLPFELYELFHTANWIPGVLFVINLAIVVLLSVRLWQERNRRPSAIVSSP
jgi:uncharacterized membrane protein (DUF2068 family)